MTKPESTKYAELTENFFIRPIQRHHSAEEREVIDLIQRCYRTSEGWTHEHRIVSGQRITAEDFRDILADPKYEVLVAEVKESKQIVGCIKAATTMETVAGPLEEEMGYFGMFSVAPEYQSKGLGSYLLAEAENLCRQKGVSKMAMEILEIRADVMKWYERCGYKKNGQCVDADPFIKAKGEILLQPTRFVAMVKNLSV